MATTEEEYLANPDIFEARVINNRAYCLVRNRTDGRMLYRSRKAAGKPYEFELNKFEDFDEFVTVVRWEVENEEKRLMWEILQTEDIRRRNFF